MPDRVEAAAPKLTHWAELLSTRRSDSFKEQELLPDFLTDFFCGLLGYTRPADGSQHYTISRETHVEVDGKFADAVLGQFNGEPHYLVALEGKGPRDPLDRPFAGRRMSAIARLACHGKGRATARFSTHRRSTDVAVGR